MVGLENERVTDYKMANATDVENEIEAVNLNLLDKTQKGTKNKRQTTYERQLAMEISEMLEKMPLNEDITCGFWIFRGKFLQRFANHNAYVILYGIVGCIFSMTFAYFNGTLTTLEKRFKIPAKNLGIITVGYDMSQLLIAGVLSYYAGKGHRPRWIGVGLLTIVFFSLLMIVPHLIYGAGEAALSLTTEFGAGFDANTTNELEEVQSKSLCRLADSGVCETEKEQGGSLLPQIIFFLAQFMAGVGGSLYASLGISYMDDNTEKSKTPALLSLAYFVRMLGPAAGYAMASFCLRLYISPQLHPVIGNEDARWLGAWWLGWIFLAFILLFFTIFLTMFPKQLPRTAAKRLVEMKRREKLRKNEIEFRAASRKPTTQASFDDMLKTFKELASNKIFMWNNWSSVFYFLGYTPFWIFTPKYIEIQYLQSAATSNMVTGPIALIFSAAGVLSSGFLISRYKPTARVMAAWNVLVGILTIAGIVAYVFVGCTHNENSFVVNIYDGALANSSATCNSACNCDYVQYSPVCGENNLSYISPCHAGCKRQDIMESGQKNFFECSCIESKNLTSQNSLTDTELNYGGSAYSRACPVDCHTQFLSFLIIMCFLKFLGAAGRSSNFLITVRSVPEEDKVAAMGFDMMMMSLLAFIPGPIIFGWLFDQLCLVWGKTCTNKGNCWHYDAVLLRLTLNLIAAILIAIGTIFDIGVWYYVKDLKIFDDKVEQQHEADDGMNVRKISLEENL